MTEFHRGDIVTIRATVQHIYEDEIYLGKPHLSLRPEHYYANIIVPTAAAALVFRHVQIGMRVRLYGNDTGTVCGLSGDTAWIKVDEGGFATVQRFEIEPLPAPQEQEAA